MIIKFQLPQNLNTLIHVNHHLAVLMRNVMYKETLDHVLAYLTILVIHIKAVDRNV